MLESINYKILKSALLAVAIVLSYLLYSCENDRPEPQKQSIQKPDTVTVAAVIDGDTFVLSSGTIVRIALIDTPEHNEPYYDSATQFLANLILDKAIDLKPVSTLLDRYGRTLAEVYRDSINVGLTILEHGLGLLYLYPENSHLKEIYLPAQLRALQEKAGIWSLPVPEPEKFYINLKGSYRFHRPLCIHLKNSNREKIRRIGSRKEALYLGLSPCRTCKP